MSTDSVQRKTQRSFLDIPSAALEAGYSARHFRRIIEEDRIPIMQIGRKFFIVTRDLEAWKSTRGEGRFQETDLTDFMDRSSDSADTAADVDGWR